MGYYFCHYFFYEICLVAFKLFVSIQIDINAMDKSSHLEDDQSMFGTLPSLPLQLVQDPPQSVLISVYVQYVQVYGNHAKPAT